MAPIASVDSAGRSHQVIVPYNRALKLIVRSAYFQISDKIGIPLQRAQSTIIPFTALQGKDLDVVFFTVTGTQR